MWILGRRPRQCDSRKDGKFTRSNKKVGVLESRHLLNVAGKDATLHPGLATVDTFLIRQSYTAWGWADRTPVRIYRRLGQNVAQDRINTGAAPCVHPTS